MKVHFPLLPPGSVLIEPDLTRPEDVEMIHAIQTFLDRPNCGHQVGYLHAEKSGMILIGIGDIPDVHLKMNALANVVSVHGCQIERQKPKCIDPEFGKDN